MSKRIHSFWHRHERERRSALYEQWVRDFSADLYRMAYRLCGHASTAEDLVQETFYHAWKGAAALCDPERARPWLLRILRHRYAHMLRDQSRRIHTMACGEGLAGQAVDTEASPSDRLAERDALQVALDALDDNLKVPLLMVLQEGLTCREAADELDIPLGTVLSRIHRARQRLRGVLEYRSRSGGDSSERKTDEDEPRKFRLRGGA